MTSSSSFAFPDIWTWIQNLPPINQWKKTNSISICICPSCSSSHPNLKLSITKSLNQSSVSLSIIADYTIPISLWISKPFNPIFNPHIFLDNETISKILLNLIEDILSYCPNKNLSLLKLPNNLDYSDFNYKDIFNFAFLSLTFVICIYEVPSDLRFECLGILKHQFSCSQARQASKMLMRIMGSNMEEQWMRTINLAITNWIVELKSGNHSLKSPSPLFSYSNSGFGLWKVQLYCPLIAMEIESSSHNLADDDRLMFSLNYHQLEGVIQLNYKVIVREKWIEVNVNTDNIRYDVVRLVNEKLMNERGAGASEKHFPSRISLHLTPITMQTNVLSISVSKSSENPTREIGLEKGIEATIEPPNPFPGLNFSAGETMTMSLRPWKFEESVYGDSAKLNWFLHDSVDGKEVFSSKPSKIKLVLQPKAWFKNRYSSAYRPFTKEGGVIFAGDEYGESVCWKFDKSSSFGKTMDWEIKGWIWLTYWPNKHRSLYSETRRAEFREILHLTLA